MTRAEYQLATRALAAMSRSTWSLCNASRISRAERRLSSGVRGRPLMRAAADISILHRASREDPGRRRRPSRLLIRRQLVNSAPGGLRIAVVDVADVGA